jgi:hypothetical protein
VINFQNWELSILATWQLLARNAEHTFNFVNFQNWELSIEFINQVNFWQEIQKSLSIGNFQIWQLSILAIFNLIHQKY